MKKQLSVMISLVFIAHTPLSGASALVSAAEHENGVLSIGESIRFDFGAADADGYIGVDASRDYFAGHDEETGLTYGFLGLGEDGYSKLNLKNDSFEMVKDQRITLYNGGEENASEAAADNVYAYQGVTVPDTDVSYDMGNGTVPVRFALKSDQHSYYQVRVTVGCADISKPAEVSIFNEKRHPVVTEAEIEAGGTYTVEFTANVMDVYYKNDKAVYADDMLNVSVLGENAGLAALEITRLDPASAPKTIWVCSDSTGCDQPAGIPFYRLQTYCGVGQYLSKYLTNMTVSNQGEGGLASSDNMHWYEAYSQWKAGDYLYVEYGHNENSTDEYSSNLEKYYTQAHEDGVKLIVVGPIDRVQDGRYNTETHTWSSSLSSYSAAGKTFVEEKIAAGAEDIAFIDLNTPWIGFLDTVTEDIAQARYRLGMDPELSFSASSTHYYYTYNKSGAADRTHINDAGADNAANIFYTQVKAAVTAGSAAEASESERVQAAVLADLAADIRSGVGPYTVTDEVIKEGYAPNSCYPAKFTSRAEYPYSASIEDIKLNADGTLSSAKVHVLQDLPQYAAVYVTAYAVDGTTQTIVSSEHIDNTSDKSGAVRELSFASDFVPSYFTAKVYYCDQDHKKLTDAEYSRAVSAEYIPLKTVSTLLETNFSETADGASMYSNGWSSFGSMPTRTMTKQTDTDGAAYANLAASGSGSAYACKAIDPVSGGKLEISFKLRYHSGTVNITTGTGRSSKNTYGTPNWSARINISGAAVKLGDLEATAINTGEWLDYRLVLDPDNKTASLTLSGYDTVTAENITFSAVTIDQFMIDAVSGTAYDIDMKDIVIRSVEEYEIPEQPVIQPEPEGRLSVQNSSFESALGAVDDSWNFNTDSTENWIPTDNSSSVSASEAHAGSCSLKLASGTVAQQINDWELYGATYVVEAWIKGDGSFTLRLGQQYASNHKYPLSSVVASTTVQGTDEWKKVALVYKTFDGWGSTSEYGFVVGLTGSDGIIYVDDVTVTRAEEALKILPEAGETETKDAVGFIHSFEGSASAATWYVSNGSAAAAVESNIPVISGTGTTVIGLLITQVTEDRADAMSAAVLVL